MPHRLFAHLGRAPRAALLLLTLTAACRRGRVEVPIPERVSDLGTIQPASSPDTAWRAAADEEARRRAAAFPLPARREPAASPAPTPVPAAVPKAAPVAAPPAGAPAAAAERAERFEDITPQAVNAVAATAPAAGAGPALLRVQVLLDRAGFSPGAIDGQWGSNTRKALYWFQNATGLRATGEADEATIGALAERSGNGEVVVRRTLTRELLRGPYVKLPESVYDRAALSCQCYESPLEELAEASHSTPAVLRQLNPGIAWEALKPGDRVWLPDVRRAPLEKGDVARVVISKTGSYAHALGPDGRIVAHLPSTLGSKYDPSPDGHFSVTRVVADPDFHYNPKLYADVPDSKPDAYLKPGPNSPVGVVWMALSEPHYGIHGTPEPETIGKTSSHGCVRLTNWDARWLAAGVKKGTPVEFR